jgi:hypothetical protein
MVTTDSVPNLKNLLMAGDRRTPEQQGRSEVQGRGRQSYRGRGKEWGEEKKRRERKGGKGRRGAGQLAIFKTAFPNVWHSAPR